MGVYIDEVFLASPAMLDARMFDVERVEVLKASRHALRRNATGGAINIINRRPTQEFEGYISGSYGDYDMVDVGAVSGGLSANTAGRSGDQLLKIRWSHSMTTASPEPILVISNRSPAEQR